jgi:hypothetical protein
MSTLRLEKISLKEFREILARYPFTVPAPLKDLDVFRYDTLPAQLASAPKGSALEKPSLKSLVEWKLCATPLSTCHLKSNLRSKHGTFRPTLLGLVDSNDATLVRSQTIIAFNLVRDTKPDKISQTSSMAVALKTLIQLRGIGPATASLVLNVMAPDWCPFLSDELYRWCVWDEGDKGKGRGWERKIAYTEKQYRVLFDKVWEARDRLGVQAVEIEKVAWVLGRTGVDLDAGDSGLGDKLGELEVEQKNLDHRQDWIEDEQDALGDKQADLDGKQVVMDAKQADLEDKQEELEELETKLKDKQTELEAKQDDLEISLLEAESKQIRAEGRQDELEWKQEDLQDELKDELKEELKAELKEELKEELKAEMKKEQKKEVRKKEVQKKAPTGTKRKAKDANLPAAGTRRSTRNNK